MSKSKVKDALVKNGADEEQVQKADDESRSEAEKSVDELKSVLESRAGRALVWRYLTFCGIYELSYTGTNEGTNFNEGKRSIGLKILAEIIDVVPEKYLLMQKEAREE